MKILLINKVLAVIILLLNLSACAPMQPQPAWVAPKGYTIMQVFTAALQAGGVLGLKTDFSDRESGVMSFSKKAVRGGEELVLNATIRDSSVGITVNATITKKSGNLINAAIYSVEVNETRKEFYANLLRNLSINSTSQKQAVPVKPVTQLVPKIEITTTPTPSQAAAPSPSPNNTKKVPPKSNTIAPPSNTAAPPNNTSVPPKTTKTPAKVDSALDL